MRAEPAVEIVTFGCRLNSFESEVMRRHARAAALRDTVIVHTCAVTAEADRQARQAIRRLRRERPEARIVVTGCGAQVGAGAYAAMPEVDHVVGNAEKLKADTWTGLPEGIAVAVGNVDAHVTAPAARATEPGQLVAIMGTSTCHVMSGEQLVDVPGMCGVVDGGIVDGLYGYEAGQSGVGDIFAWYVKNQVPQSSVDDAAAAGKSVHQHLTDLAYEQPVGAHGLVALDWHSGNRSVLVDHELSGLVLGLTLATRPEDIYRALIEATAFGARTIVDTFNESGVPVREFVVAGGLLPLDLRGGHVRPAATPGRRPGRCRRSAACRTPCGPARARARRPG